MTRWTMTHTTACLWLIAAVVALGWLAGLVSEYDARQAWGTYTPPPAHVKPVPASACDGSAKGAWCP